MNNTRCDIVDCHAHVIPRADHGSYSTNDSLAELALASEVGVNRIIATPHFYPEVHDVSDFIESRNAGYRRLLQRIPENAPEIRLGAEVLICNGIDRFPGLERLFLHGTNMLLLELPFADFQHEYCNSVYSLVRGGVEVIVAHADRYNPENIERLIDSGAKLQLNADSLCGFFKRRKLYEWMERELVVALGSDIHTGDKAAYKRFAKAISKIGIHADFIANESDKIWQKTTKHE